jgi:hypothetical protein
MIGIEQFFATIVLLHPVASPAFPSCRVQPSTQGYDETQVCATKEGDAEVVMRFDTLDSYIVQVNTLSTSVLFCMGFYQQLVMDYGVTGGLTASTWKVSDPLTLEWTLRDGICQLSSRMSPDLVRAIVADQTARAAAAKEAAAPE